MGEALTASPLSKVTTSLLDQRLSFPLISTCSIHPMSDKSSYRDVKFCLLYLYELETQRYYFKSSIANLRTSYPFIKSINHHPSQRLPNQCKTLLNIIPSSIPSPTSRTHCTCISPSQTSISTLFPTSSSAPISSANFSISST